MMERIARLVTASTALRRKIWASLPFRVRLADVFSRLASSGTDAFGKVMFGEFLQRGVVGLPDIHGKPALEMAGGRNITNKLPPGYGRAFGKQCFVMLMGWVHNPEVAEEIMSEFAVDFLESGSKHLREGSSLQEAESYVLRGLKNENLNRLRLHENARRDRNTFRTNDDDEESVFEHMPTFDETTVEKLFDERMLPKVRQKLHAIHPDAEQYVKLMLDGHSDREILGDPEHGEPSLLKHPFTNLGKPLNENNWGASYKPKIFNILKKQFADLQHHHTV